MKKKVILASAAVAAAAGLTTGGYLVGHTTGEHTAAPVPAFGLDTCRERPKPADPLNVMGSNWPDMTYCTRYAAGMPVAAGLNPDANPGHSLAIAASDIDAAQRDITKIVRTRGLSDPAGARRDIYQIRADLDRKLTQAAHDAVGTPGVAPTAPTAPPHDVPAGG